MLAAPLRLRAHKVRPDAQLLLARRAPPRPDLAAAGDKARKRALQCEWVASWEGHPLAAAAALVDVDGPAAQRAEELRRLPELVLRQLSDLEASAELAEAWADAFEARWGLERAVAAGVRDAVLRARGHVDQCARVRDEMEVVAREARISLRGQSPSAW